MLTDFVIICIGQAAPSFPECLGELSYDEQREREICTLSENEKAIEFEPYKRRQGDEPIYDDFYHFGTADALAGVLYFVWHREFLEDSFFDFAGEAGSKHVCIVPKWDKTVRELLEYYISQSPEHRIAVLLRMQDRSDDTVHEPCGIDEFMRLLRCGEAVWNELYLVE